MTTGTRHRMRKALLQAVYAWLMETDDPEAVLDQALRSHRVDEENCSLAHDLFQGIMAHREATHGLLEQLLEHWTVERVGQVERAACHLALQELRACPQTPVEVVIDEAVRLCKEYAGVESAHFVNGVLDSAARILRAARTP